jgi:hypothetical protein
MSTRPHLSQIQSSDPKYKNLLEEIISINSNIQDLSALSTNAIVDSYEDLINLEDRQIGFYLVRTDETYRNNPTHYFYNGTDFKMVGGKIPDGILKKTVVFFIKRLNEIGQSMKLYVPYKGYISNISVCTLGEYELSFKLLSGDELIDEFEVNSALMGWDVYYEVNHPILTLELTGGEVGIQNINVNVDIIVEE